jgi:hypothetical protein
LCQLSASGPSRQGRGHSIPAVDRGCKYGRATVSIRRRCLDRPAVSPQHHIGIEQVEKAIEVPAARSGQEGLHDLLLASPGGGLSLFAPLHPTSRSARQLSRCGGGAVQNRSDVVEGHGKEVMEHECHALSWTQRVENLYKRRSKEIGLDYGGLGRRRRYGGGFDGLFAPGSARAKYPETDPRHHGGEPSSQVRHL